MQDYGWRRVRISLVGGNRGINYFSPKIMVPLRAMQADSKRANART